MMNSYEDVKAYLYGLRHHGAKYGIERMELLAEALGHPENAFPVIHVAGTNGKGSTCAMLEAIFRSGGYKTGLFTSPHLVFLGERIQVNRHPLDRDSIISHSRRLREVAENLAAVDSGDHPSFFEFVTAMAFMRFCQEEVDIGIIETGLGGRLDATNIVRPEITVITSISYDHCDILGHSLEQIALEKAGIIKEGRPLVLGHLPGDAEDVIRGVARQRGVELFSIKERFGSDLDGYPSTNLKGRYQRWNAAVATMVAERLSEEFPVTKETADSALQSVHWPARWDAHFVGGKKIYFDTSHNLEGADMLCENLEDLIIECGRKPVVIVGTLGSFRAGVLMPVVARYARQIVLLIPAQPRAASFQELRAAIPTSYQGNIVQSTVREVFPFPGHCAMGEDNDILVATGSIYLIGEIMDAVFHDIPIHEHILQ